MRQEEQAYWNRLGRVISEKKMTKHNQSLQAVISFLREGPLFPQKKKSIHIKSVSSFHFYEYARRLGKLR